jgi:hypothetical protein
MSSQNNQPNYFYYDLLVSNVNNDTTVLPKALTFLETRSIPYLYNPKDYSLSITRFSLSTASLPVMIPTIQPNQGGINETVYKITIVANFDSLTIPSGNELVTTKVVEFVPQNISASLPVSPLTTADGLQDNSTGYYSIYSYEYFIGLVNNSISEIFTELITYLTETGQLPSNFSSQAFTSPPILSFDTSTNLATMFIPYYVSTDGNSTQLWQSRYTKTQTLHNSFSIYFNSGLYNLLNSIPCFNSQGYTSPSTGVYYPNAMYNVIVPSQSNNYPKVSVPVGAPSGSQWYAYPITQEYSTINSWSPVSSIVITSNTLPIVQNQLSNPLIYVNNVQFSLSTTGSNFAQIITDFQSDSNFKTDGMVQYLPTAEYRRVQLYGTTPLNTIDVSVYWMDKNGKMWPFYLLAGGHFQMKFLFEKNIKV